MATKFDEVLRTVERSSELVNVNKACDWVLTLESSD